MHGPHLLLLPLDVSAQEVSYSNKQQEDGVCPGDRINLSCVSIDSQSHAWSSAEYINSEQLRFSVDDPDNIRHKSPQNPDVVAWLTNVSQVNGVSQITSSLNITILPSITMRNHSVECINSDVGTRSTVTFHYAGKRIIIDIIIPSKNVKLDKALVLLHTSVFQSTSTVNKHVLYNLTLLLSQMIVLNPPVQQLQLLL